MAELCFLAGWTALHIYNLNRIGYNVHMKRRYRKIAIYFAVLIILAVGFFGLNKKFNFVYLGEGNSLANQPPSSFQSFPGVSSNSGATLPSGSQATSPDSGATNPPASSAKSILLAVPFFSQAPFGEWSDPLYQNACEEASVIMAMHWVNKTSVTLEQAKQEIYDLSTFEDKTYGAYYDRSAGDTIKMFKDYFHYSNVREKEGISTKDIKAEILAGHLVIVPLNGQILKNPYYSGAGPNHHMLVVIGWDAHTDEFITNDVGTRHGEKYRYAEAKFQASLQDYPTGNDLPATPGKTAMIVVNPK